MAQVHDVGYPGDRTHGVVLVRDIGVGGACGPFTNEPGQGVRRPRIREVSDGVVRDGETGQGHGEGGGSVFLHPLRCETR